MVLHSLVSSFLPTCYLSTTLMCSSFSSCLLNVDKCWYFQGSFLVHLLFTFSRVFLDDLYHSHSFTYPSAGLFFFLIQIFPLPSGSYISNLQWQYPLGSSQIISNSQMPFYFFFQLFILEIWYHPYHVCPLPLPPHCGPVNSTPLKSYFHSPSLQLLSYLTTVVSPGLLQEPLYFSNCGQNKLSKMLFQ